MLGAAGKTSCGAGARDERLPDDFGEGTLRFTPASSHDYDAADMPEATALYVVTAVVLAVLVLWVAVVLKTAKDPWARAVGPDGLLAANHAGPESSVQPSVASPPSEAADASEPVIVPLKDAPTIVADSTARATPVALASEHKAKTAALDSAGEATDEDKAEA